MRISKSKKAEIRKAYEAGEIKELGNDCYSVPHRFFVLGITPRMVNQEIKEIKAT